MLTGTGTAGAYHAGVLRALHEAGVKIDLVAGRGIGAVGAFVLGIVFLGESMTPMRIAAAMLILSGLVLMRLSAAS
mgnify:CR=1 FL=1